MCLSLELPDYTALLLLVLLVLLVVLWGGGGVRSRSAQQYLSPAPCLKNG